MTSITTNIAALRAQNAVAIAIKSMQPAMAGIAAVDSGDESSPSTSPDIARMSQGIRNANDGLSLAQTADGALSELTSLAQRVREIAVRAATGTVTDDDRAGMQAEVSQLSAQINGIVANTTFNGLSLFGNSGGSSSSTFSIQTSSDAGGGVDITIPSLNADVGSGFQVAASVDGAGTAIGGATNASSTIGAVDDFLKTIGNARANLGGAENSLNSVVNVLTSRIEAISDQRSQIDDNGFSRDTAALAKSKILTQASTAVLAQANHSQQSVLSLLR